MYDDRYHCFGCGAHGDAISFVMQSQGLSFMEAVSQLAGEAGLEVPKSSPEAAEANAGDWTSSACSTSYRRIISDAGASQGRAARDYLLGPRPDRGDHRTLRSGLGRRARRADGGPVAARDRYQQLTEAGLIPAVTRKPVGASNCSHSG